MAIRPLCDFCGKELTKFGALLFSPPKGLVGKKFHLCQPCYNKIFKKLKKK